MDFLRRPLPPPPVERQKPTWYFAYGSNLHLAQMAKRCPNSRFIGRATLRHYKWMINERGFANIVPAPGYWVEGLVFELHGEDEFRLDRNEGVSKKCYLKRYEKLEVHFGPKCLFRRPVPWIVHKGGPARILEQARSDGSLAREHQGRMREEVLVYISPDFIKYGEPKEEYITRINNGVKDARILGISDDYINRFIREWVIPSGQATRPPLQSFPQKPARRLSIDGSDIGSRPRPDLRRDTHEVPRGRPLPPRPEAAQPSKRHNFLTRTRSVNGGRYEERVVAARNVTFITRPARTRRDVFPLGLFSGSF